MFCFYVTLQSVLVNYFGVLYNCNMKEGLKLSVECNPSAFKHGITEEDIRFAFDNKLFDHPVAHQLEEKLWQE